jgi:hypothetical protein
LGGDASISTDAVSNRPELIDSSEMVKGSLATDKKTSGEIVCYNLLPAISILNKRLCARHTILLKQDIFSLIK